MTKQIQGLHKIVGHMFMGPMTLSELTKASGLKKPSVHYHMKNLSEEGIVTFNKKTGKYSVEIRDELKKEILAGLKSKRTIEQLVQELKRRAPHTESKLGLRKLVGDKEFKTKLNDLLEFLYDEGLVNEISEGTAFNIDGSYARFTDYWVLTFLGSEKLGICHECKKPLEDGYAIAQFIKFDEPISEFHAPLIHAKCFSNLEERAFYDQTGLPVSSYDNCDFCGLSLSEKRLKSSLEYGFGFFENQFSVIHDLLKKYEIEALNSYCQWLVKEKFARTYGLNPPEWVLKKDWKVSHRNRR